MFFDTRFMVTISKKIFFTTKKLINFFVIASNLQPIEPPIRRSDLLVEFFVVAIVVFVVYLFIYFFSAETKARFECVLQLSLF